MFEDLQFLDIWKPPGWLVAEPNYDEAAKLKKLMLDKYGHYLRAWRMVMDKDNSNTCNWNEFCAAMRSMKFHGDIAGAWLAIDDDVSGAISLNEIDSVSNAMLLEFKRWADEEFGSVRSAFKVLDKDHSSELTLQEFSAAVRSYGYTGQEILLFKCLDANGQGQLSLNEMSFLDDWEIPELENDDEPGAVGRDDGRPDSHSGSVTGHSLQERSLIDSTYEYSTEGPGPGSYEVLSTFAILPRMPTSRHTGAWTFQKRPDPAWLAVTKNGGPGCADFDVDRSLETRRKPAWSFSSQARAAAMTAKVGLSPGPGSYQVCKDLGDGPGPKFSFGSRRGVVIHPQQKAVRNIKASHTPRLVTPRRFC
eukprot:TRINITY_DN69170_c0_g1_i1.p1 TRINITY_DN69170_c0_g1~~TRINITY_DN69170_c0_g1_i1.p1  ORF type:complete len:423 (-),score=82.90 TRINITY_DN69170_c0_g1_i1:107-1195(-)